VEIRRIDVGREREDGVQRKLCKKVLRIHRNSTHGAAEGEHRRQSGRGKMVNAATNTVRVRQSAEEEPVRQCYEWQVRQPRVE
jgi:hypothetical protein